MSKITDLKDELAQYKQSLEAAKLENNSAAVKEFEAAISEVEAEIKGLESEADNKPEKPKKADKPEKKPKAKKPEKKVKEPKPEKAFKKAKKETPPCDELATAWEKRMSAVRKASKTKTTPITKIIATKMEGVVKSVIAYNKKKGGDLNLSDIRDAVKLLATGLDKLKEAIKGEFSDTFIDAFEKDMMKIIKALEKAENSK
jgi:chromosome segregation ATPase